MVFIVGGAGISRHRSSSSGSGTYRYPWIQPFSADSYVNKGIGSGAIFGPTNDSVYAALQAAGNLYPQPPQNAYNAPFWLSTSTNDPLYTCTSSPFPGNNEFPSGQPSYSGQMHLQSGAYPASGGDNVIQVMDEANPRALWGFNNGTSIGGGNISGSGTFWDTIGNGVPYSGQGGCNLIGWRQVDVQNGYVNRMLPVAMPSTSMYAWGPDQTDFGIGYNCVWPAVGSDYWHVPGDGQGGNYNTSAGVPFGSIIFAPASVFTVNTTNMQSLLGHSPSTLEMAAALQLQNYGLLVSNQAGGFVVETSWDWDQTSHNTVNNVYSLMTKYLRVMGSWMYAPGMWGLIGRGATPGSAPGTGYQYDARYNASAPINGGGGFPAAPPDFYPSLNIGNGRTYKTSGALNGWGAL